MNTPIIVCAAIRKGDIIIPGPRHFDGTMIALIKQFNETNQTNEISFWDAEQGFIDQFGRFYDRKDALEVARRASQVINYSRNISQDELFSEGLY